MKAVRFGGNFEFQVVVIAVVAYVLDAMYNIIEVCHFMELGCGKLGNGAIQIFGAEVDFSIFFSVGVPYFMDTAPAISPTSSVRGYGDRRASQFILVKMLAQQVEHFLGFLYDFRYLQHGCVLLKDMFYFCE